MENRREQKRTEENRRGVRRGEKKSQATFKNETMKVLLRFGARDERPRHCTSLKVSEVWQTSSKRSSNSIRDFFSFLPWEREKERERVKARERKNERERVKKARFHAMVIHSFSSSPNESNPHSLSPTPSFSPSDFLSLPPPFAPASARLWE